MLFLNTSLSLTSFKLSRYKPYINYTWSQTLTVSGTQQIKNIGNSGQDLQLFSGQGCWLNGIDQKINFETSESFNDLGSIALTFKTSSVIKNIYVFSNRLSNNRLYLNQTSNELRLGLGGGFVLIPLTLMANTIYKVLIGFDNGNYTFKINEDLFQGSYTGLVNEQFFTLNNTEQYTQYTDTYLYKDLYMFSRALTQIEIELYNNQPNQFFMDSLGDSSCILAMPMCEKNNLVRNYKNNTDYPITNYLATCRTNAQRLPYGLQTSGFKRNTNGLILSNSNFLECDGVGYCNTMWVPKWNEDFTVETVLEMSHDLEFRLNGNTYANGVYFGENPTGNNLYVKVFGSPTLSITNTKNIVCLTFAYNKQSKEVKGYIDGVFATTALATQTTNSTLPVLLGMVALSGTNYPVIKPLRLFKVHSKVLTQEEITKNFNKYQSQGLLNE